MAMKFCCWVIEKINQREKLKIKSLHYDTKASLLRGLRNSFDVVFSDPPYTPNGLRLFLSRAVEAVRDEGVFYFCYGYTDRARERGLEAQRIISQAGILIEEKLPGFNVYYGAQSIGSRSSLYILKMTPKTKVMIKGRFKGPIYTGQKRK
jgi:predicted methyltransferase